MRAIATCALLALTAAATPAGLTAGTPAALTVRLYNTAGISTPALQAARRTAESIVRDAGLTVVFRHCGRRVFPAEPVDQCADRLHPHEVVVRVVHAPTFNATLPPEAFGVAYVVKETDRGWLATLFSDRIDQAAARIGVDAGALMGFVMTHEIGHLLLGVDYHSENGVMRADWPDAVLDRSGRQLRFSTLEAARMRHAASLAF